MPWTSDQLMGADLLALQERHRSRMRWSEWLAAAGSGVLGGGGQGITNDYSVLLHAAMEGQGVALGWHHLVSDLVAQGRLVRPMAEAVTTDEPLWLNAPPGRSLDSATELLRDWLLDHA
jgi:DNA-binding transcriptional LysR family regulator